MAEHPKPDAPELTIYRDLWQRGGDGDTALLNHNGMCCLGFMAMAAGVSGSDMYDVFEPHDLDFECTGLPLLEDMVDHEDCPLGTRFSDEAVAINDSYIHSSDAIEESLIKLFEGIGTTLTFEDEAPDEFRAAYEKAVNGK